MSYEDVLIRESVGDGTIDPDDVCYVCEKRDCVCPPEDDDREHIERMVARHKEVLECEHKYVEQTTAPLGVRCTKCGHFVGAWE